MYQASLASSETAGEQPRAPHALPWSELGRIPQVSTRPGRAIFVHARSTQGVSGARSEVLPCPLDVPWHW